MASPASAPVSRRYAYYALAVIFTANFLSYLDRQIVSALEKELRAAFDLSEKGFGGLWTAFTVGYMVFAPVIGFMTDRISRPRIFAVCIFLWSLATIASGLAVSPSQLYAARFFIGIGEAGCLIIGPTLIADYFAREVRGKALSVFFLGLPLGGTAGYLLPAFVDKLVGGWAPAFYIAGAPGIVLAAVVWFLIDPPRGGDPEHSSERIVGVAPYLDLLRNRTLMLIILAQAFAVLMLVPLLHFGIGFFETKHGMGKDEASLALGGIALVAGGLGNWLSGVIGDRLARKRHGAYAFLASIAFTAGLPFLVVGFTASQRWIFLPAIGLGAFCYFLCMPAVNTQIANVVAPRKRAMAYALAVFLLHLLGDMAVPIVFGAASESLGRQSAFLAFSSAMLLAGGCAWLGSRTAARDEEKAAAEALPVKPAEPETGTG